uniref:Lipoprotein signal peptidase n=1 Tax=Paulinella micropora TaxID=1928728 RepID=A0A1L5YBH4_9EUKA|nr:lipoprotein signal peptidase [Paulinella micropora]AQX44808.1 lipoprotein signal peptidase [Paulinella micropora]
MTLRIRRYQTFLFSILFIILDQTSKYWSALYLPKGILQDWIPNLVGFKLIFNQGAAFNILQGSVTLLSVISAITMLILIYWILFKHISRVWQTLAIAFLLGGTIGNGLDRWQLGFVVDFIALIRFDFPVFNEADLAINLAVVCFILDRFSHYRYRKN